MQLSLGIFSITYIPNLSNSAGTKPFLRVGLGLKRGKFDNSTALWGMRLSQTDQDKGVTCLVISQLRAVSAVDQRLTYVTGWR